MNFSFLDKADQPPKARSGTTRHGWQTRRTTSQQWGNFGGDKSWPNFRPTGRQFRRRGWPPPTGFDAAADAIEINGTEVTLTTPVDTSYGIRERRVIKSR